VLYLLVSLGGILGDILGGILGDSLRSATATVVVEYCSCSVVMETLSLVRYPWRRCALLVL
jgi:hypothetical protein